MNEAALLTAVARLLVIYPLIMFFLQQMRFHGNNGHTGMVRRATLSLVLFLILMFCNLVYVNISTAMNNSPVIGWAQWISFLTSAGFAWASWHMWSVFRRFK